MTPHVLDVQVADNQLVKTAGLVPLQLEVCELSGIVLFSVFDSFGSGK